MEGSVRFPAMLIVAVMVGGCSANPSRYVDGTQLAYKHLEVSFSATTLSMDSSQYTLILTNRSADTIYIPTKYTVMSCTDSAVSFDNSIAIGDVVRPGDQFACATWTGNMSAIEYEIDVTRLLPGESVTISLRGRAILAQYVRVGLNLSYNTGVLSKRVRRESSRYITTNGSFWTIGFESIDASFHYRNR